MPGKVERPADLYAVPPEQFTAARQALVASLRKAGDAAGAAEAAAIKRPTRALWAVNQLARQDGTVVARLIDAAERLKMAQLGRRPGGDMREASEAYQALLKRCEEHARALLQPVGPGLTVAVRNRLTRTLAAWPRQSRLCTRQSRWTAAVPARTRASVKTVDRGVLGRIT